MSENFLLGPVLRLTRGIGYATILCNRYEYPVSLSEMCILRALFCSAHSLNDMVSERLGVVTVTGRTFVMSLRCVFAPAVEQSVETSGC